MQLRPCFRQEHFQERHIAYKKNGIVFVRSGAGIVADSDPEKEFQECINKAKASLKALEVSQEVEE